tara:strand:- start:1485 stop:1748 length:264 start_codon:yes stop_codon:yes gene_type:complete
MEDVGNPETGLRTETRDFFESFTQSGSGHHAILNNVVWGKATHSRKGALAALPDEHTLGVVLGDPNFLGAGFANGVGKGDEFRFYSG